jgi:hypothetical protein
MILFYSGFAAMQLLQRNDTASLLLAITVRGAIIQSTRSWHYTLVFLMHQQLPRQLDSRFIHSNGSGRRMCFCVQLISMFFVAGSVKRSVALCFSCLISFSVVRKHSISSSPLTSSAFCRFSFSPTLHFIVCCFSGALLAVISQKKNIIVVSFSSGSSTPTLCWFYHSAAASFWSALTAASGGGSRFA